MVVRSGGQHDSEWAAISEVARLLGVTARGDGVSGVRARRRSGALAHARDHDRRIRLSWSAYGGTTPNCEGERRF